MTITSKTKGPSAKDTLLWVEDTWTNKASPWFESLLEHIRKGFPIPAKFMLQQKEGGGWNPTLRFLRTKSACSITSVYTKTPSALKLLADNVLNDCIRPYVRQWEDLFDALDHYYGDNGSTTITVRNAFHSLILKSGVFRIGFSDKKETPCDIGDINPQEHSHAFNQFLDRFSALPRSNGSSRKHAHVLCYPAIPLGDYAVTIFKSLNRNMGIVELKGTKEPFHVSPYSDIVWTILTELAAGSSLHNGYVHLSMSSSKWQPAFSKGGGTRKRQGHGTHELLQFIHSQPGLHKGLFRIQRDKKTPRSIPSKAAKKQ